MSLLLVPKAASRSPERGRSIIPQVKKREGAAPAAPLRYPFCDAQQSDDDHGDAGNLQHAVAGRVGVDVGLVQVVAEDRARPQQVEICGEGKKIDN